VVAVEDGVDSLVSRFLCDGGCVRMEADTLGRCRFNLVNHNQHGVDTAKYGQKESSSS
jgi:hypothetical protein